MERNRNNIYAAGSITILLLGLLFTASGCTDSTAVTQEKTTVSRPENSDQLLQADEVLHKRLQAVQEADDQYAQLFTHAITTAAIDKKNEEIAQAEMALQQTIDSLEQVQTKNNAGDTNRLAHLTGYFKSALQNRRALSDLRMVLSADSDDSTAAQQKLFRLNNELQEKNKRIAALEQEKKDNPDALIGDLKGLKKLNYAPARGEGLADLQQRNKNLALALNNLQVKYFIIGRNYLVLKQEHERTTKELDALRKSANQK